MDKRLLTIGLVMFTEVLGWSLILPFLPYYAESFGATPFIVGLILSSFSVCQFFSAPIIGKLSDRYGRKPLFIVSQLATMAGFVILGFANSLWMIVLSRVVDGLFGSNMTLIHAYLGDISKGKNRAKFMGYFGAFFGMGMFIGPAVGGFLAAINYSIPSFIAAGMTLVSMVLIFVFLEETVKRDSKLVVKRGDFFPLKPLLESLKNAHLRRLFVEFFLFIIAFTTITSSLALFVKHQLNFGPEDVGMALLLVGIFRTVFQLTALPKIIDNFTLKGIRVAGLTIMFLAMVLVGFTVTRFALYGVIVLFSIGGGMTRPMIITSITNYSRVSDRGKLMGVTDSLASVSQIIGPLIGGFVIEHYNPGYIGFISAFFVLVAVIYELSCRNGKAHCD